jgi:hypothetical protein
MVLVNTPGLTKENTKVIGRIIKWMEMVLLYGQMVKNI